MNTLKVISLFLISLSANAAFEGEYTKSSGPQSCPEGIIKFKELKEDNQKVLIFGARHSWTFSADTTRTQFTEKDDPEDCQYDYKYSLENSKISYQTKRSRCAEHSENSIIEESFLLDKQVLTYTFKMEADDKKSANRFECTYKKIK